MKTTEQLKRELHKYIDSIDDQKTLMMVHEDLLVYIKSSPLENTDDGLTKEQQKQLQDAIGQADAGEFVSEEEYSKATARWRTK